MLKSIVKEQRLFLENYGDPNQRGFVRTWAPRAAIGGGLVAAGMATTPGGREMLGNAANKVLDTGAGAAHYLATKRTQAAGIHGSDGSITKNYGLFGRQTVNSQQGTVPAASPPSVPGAGKPVKEQEQARLAIGKTPSGDSVVPANDPPPVIPSTPTLLNASVGGNKGHTSETSLDLSRPVQKPIAAPEGSNQSPAIMRTIGPPIQPQVEEKPTVGQVMDPWVRRAQEATGA